MHGVGLEELGEYLEFIQTVIFNSNSGPAVKAMLDLVRNHENVPGDPIPQ
jgi:hypothetical protein